MDTLAAYAVANQRDYAGQGDIVMSNAQLNQVAQEEAVEEKELGIRIEHDRIPYGQWAIGGTPYYKQLMLDVAVIICKSEGWLVPGQGWERVRVIFGKTDPRGVNHIEVELDGRTFDTRYFTYARSHGGFKNMLDLMTYCIGIRDTHRAATNWHDTK